MSIEHSLAAHLIAHRGYQRLYPENSLLAIEEAIACGALFFETDVQFSADGVPLLFHDENLQRVCGRDGKVSQCRWLDLQTFTANEPSRLNQQFISVKIAQLSSLVDILLRFPKVQAFIELKEEAVRSRGATFCLRAIQAALAPVLSRCVLISFDISALQKAKNYGFKRVGPVVKNWKNRQTIARDLSAEVLFCDQKRIPEEEDLHLNDCALAIYEVGDIDTARQLLARGAQFIETFAIGEMLGCASLETIANQNKNHL